MQKIFKKDASLTLCERPLESSEGEHAKSLMPSYQIKTDYRQQVN